MVSTRLGRMPMSDSCPPIQPALVLTVWPINSSSPMERMVAVISLDMLKLGN
jgi:hypothetical protein